jgi:hypothetical protein
MDHLNSPTPPLEESLKKFQKHSVEAKRVLKGSQSVKKDYLRRKPIVPIQQKSDPGIKGPKISMIGAAAMGKLVSEGMPAYFLHITPVAELEQGMEQLRAGEVRDGEERVNEDKEVEELSEEEKMLLREKEKEELEKHVPPQY